MREPRGRAAHLYRLPPRTEGADRRTRTLATARRRDRRALAVFAAAPLALVTVALLLGWCTRAEHPAPPPDDRAAPAAGSAAPAAPAFANVLPAAVPPPREMPRAAVTPADEPPQRTILAIPAADLPRSARITGRLADSGGFSVAGARMRAVAAERQAPDAFAPVDDYGRFAFAGLRHGRWTLSVDPQASRAT